MDNNSTVPDVERLEKLISQLTSDVRELMWRLDELELAVEKMEDRLK